MLSDPGMIDSNLSRAIDLAFDNKNVSGYTNSKMTPSVSAKDGKQQKDKQSKAKHKLKINSDHLISLEEKNEFDS